MEEGRNPTRECHPERVSRSAPAAGRRQRRIPSPEFPSGRRTGAALTLLLALVLLTAAAAAAVSAAAPAGGAFSLARGAVAAGGLHAAGGGFELHATAGQPAAGLIAGPAAQLQAGFWSAPAVTAHRLVLPLVLQR